MEVREVEERATVSIRDTTPVNKLPEVMGVLFGQIMSFVARKRIHVDGPPFALYHTMDVENVDVEVGVPVAQEVHGHGRIRPGVLPAGRVVTATHLGPYETIEETYNRLMEFIKEHGFEAETFMYEFYLNDPEEVPPEEIKTEVFVPIKM